RAGDGEHPVEVTDVQLGGEIGPVTELHVVTERECVDGPVLVGLPRLGDARLHFDTARDELRQGHTGGPDDLPVVNRIGVRRVEVCDRVGGADDHNLLTGRPSLGGGGLADGGGGANCRGGGGVAVAGASSQDECRHRQHSQ